MYIPDIFFQRLPVFIDIYIYILQEVRLSVDLSYGDVGKYM